MASNTQSLVVGPGGGSGNTAFMQQGQVDWVAFGNTIYSASLATMQRLASAGVQPITHGAGLALSGQFQLSSQGSRRMEEALLNLKCFAGFEKILYFGFGVQSFVRLLGESQLGINCLALCSCLTDCHSLEVAAWTLAELWQVLEFPIDYAPSHQQLLALVTACSGVIASTTFGTTVAVMLGSGRRKPGGFEAPREWGGSGQKDIARVLTGLFKISKGEKSNMTVNGGSECAFIAAFAHWLLGLSVHVEDEKGSLIFTTVLDEEEAQLRVQYTNIQEPAAEMQISNNSYILGGFQDLLADAHSSAFYMVARVPWDTCLSFVFGGPSLSKLLAAPDLLATYLGGTARLMEAASAGDETLPPVTREAFSKYRNAQHGRGLIRTLVGIFPELARISNFQEKMCEVGGSNSLEEVMEDVDETIRSFRLLCPCHLCAANDSLTSYDSFCMVVLARTIRLIASTLGPVRWDPLLCPTDLGLLEFYEPKPRVFKNENVSYYHLQPNHEGGYDIIEFLASIFIGPRQHSVLVNVAQGFSAIPMGSSALSRNGICIFLNALCYPSTRMEDARIVHVCPGRIAWRDQEYSSVWDGGQRVYDSERGIKALKDNVVLESFNADLLRQDPVAFEDGLSAVVRERSVTNSLHFYYRARLSSGGHLDLQPHDLTWLVLRRVGPLVCRGKDCTDDLSLPCWIIQKGCCLDQEHLGDLNRQISSNSTSQVGPKCVIWPPLSNLSRCIALYISKTYTSNHRGMRTTYLRVHGTQVKKLHGGA
ncbi:MAG: hypothetical protein M1823_002484 [Watsoniomyces obsoletus]|nr:MAG: hypothetical protein M1823_002484 [Watsoniomyces obsoletus]